MSTRPPLPDRLRPRTLDEVVGQERWLAPGAPLRTALEARRPSSMVLWGPPGCGKTTLARLLASHADAEFVPLSAVLDGVPRLREVVSEAREARARGRATLVFVDEIHRWNKAQQDALLPHVEDGTILLVGATTENPSFELNAALRSRLRVVRLDPLPTAAVEGLLARALVEPEGLGRPDLEVDAGLLHALAASAAGDARRALLDLERAVEALRPGEALTFARVRDVLQRADLRHDRAGDDHHDVVSAMIKSLRGSDPDAALYWLARMIAGGESVRYIARRLIVFASEDVGNADPRALQVAVAAAQGAELVGLPEARIVLAQAVTWLACAPKSNAAYVGIGKALGDVERTGALPVPLHLRNAPTEAMRAEGFGQGYLYPHDFPYRIVRQAYRPSEVAGARYYEPTPFGEEKTIRERLAWWQEKLGR
jgi:putative ATPase